MRKIFCSMALITGVLLLLCGGAGASTRFYKLSSLTVSPTTLEETSSSRDVSIDMYMSLSMVISDDETESVEGYVQSADIMIWEFSRGGYVNDQGSGFNFKRATITLNSHTFTVYDNLYKMVSADWDPDSPPSENGTYNKDVHVVLCGTLEPEPEDDLSIIGSICSKNGDSYVRQQSITATITMTPADTRDYGNVDSIHWNGLDPTFGEKGGSDKSKPKVYTTKVSAFTAGETGERIIRITGSQPLVDVYIAGKDAVKLFGLDKDQRKNNIQLTKANIKKYNIPFRVTSYDITEDDGKYASSYVTIAFNGANVAYKGYPITFALENNATTKPVTKAVKIDVTPNKIAPYWMEEATTTPITDSSGNSVYSEQKIIPATSTDVLESDQENYEVTSIDMDAVMSGDVISTDSEGKYAVMSPDATQDDGYTIIYVSEALTTASQDEGFAYVYYTDNIAAISYYVDYTTTAYTAITDNKAREVAVALKSTNGVIEPVVYKVSGDGGPYIITGKPVPDKLPTKYGVTYTITQPVINGWGEVSEDGYVTISGKLTELTKETKTSLTFSATNPSTKKKSDLKLKVIGKIPPTFDERKIDSDGYLDGVKYTTAGKVPSIKFKAKGSKTITYDIPDADDVAELTAVGLSFDSKKGAIKALTTAKNTLPTSKDGEFEPIVITARAKNEAGSATLKARVGLYGAKPKFVTKAIQMDEGYVDYYKVKVKVGSSYVGPETAGANVIFAPESTTDTTTLSGLGLAIVNWNEIKVTFQSPEVNLSGDEVVSADYATFASGDVISHDGVLGSHDVNFKVVSGSIATVLSTDETSSIDIASSDTVTVAWGSLSDDTFVYDTKTVSAEVTTYVPVVVSSPDESLKNTLIFQVVDASKHTATGKWVPVNIKATNIGSEVVGKLKISIRAASTSTTSRNEATQDSNRESESAGTLGRTSRKTSSRSGSEGLSGGAESESESSLTLGRERTIADLTPEQRERLEMEGLMVVAVLPEMTADESGQYDIDAELDESAPEGEKMVWLAFPKGEPSEDDEIVDFYDEAGALIEDVPANHKVIVSPWLREGVIYEPVIAVKVK